MSLYCGLTLNLVKKVTFKTSKYSWPTKAYPENG